MNTKEQLLNQAVIIFVERGYDNTSINDITNACNITKGAFYHHFKNKDEIFIEAITVIVDEIEKWIDEKILSSKNIEELIKSLFDYSDYFTYSKYYDNVNSDTYLVLMNAIKKFPEFKKKVAEYFFRYIPFIEEKFKKAQDQGEVNSNIDANIFALHVFVLVEGLMYTSAITGTESSLIHNGEIIANHLWTMIKTLS